MDANKDLFGGLIEARQVLTGYYLEQIADHELGVFRSDGVQVMEVESNNHYEIYASGHDVASCLIDAAAMLKTPCSQWESVHGLDLGVFS